MRTVKCGFQSVPGGKPANGLLILMGPTLIVDIGFDPAFTSTTTTPPISGIQSVHALVDTGATESCIDNLLAAQLGLPIIDRRSVSGSSGKHDVNVYMAQVHVPSLPYTIWGAFAGVDLKAGGQVHGALIGRTFLANFKMEYDGTTGDVTLTTHL